MWLKAAPCSIFKLFCDRTVLPVGIVVNADDTFTILVKMYKDKGNNH